MEQRLAEFREARKRAGLVSQPSTASQGEQTSAAKAEPAAATPKTATGWLRRFLKRKASPAIMRARPNQAQEEAQQPPQSAAVPLPSSRHQSLLTNITFLKVLLWLSWEWYSRNSIRHSAALSEGSGWGASTKGMLYLNITQAGLEVIIQIHTASTQINCELSAVSAATPTA
ncbi:SAYSvFN domain-containing protein 1 isoform X3 [Alexandromys fortis]|uniref:SAYSvFN domain-containing protein 1 isoform X3 n=1 Tax=Alexandromys fortis TaxID=100897 RepID=UPI002152E325|nr:SAYSvFN domain-containing protein 1 isoform X3 [Microtus fortis]